MEVEEIPTPKRKRKEKNPGYTSNKKIKHTDENAAPIEIEKKPKTKPLKISFLRRNPSLPEHYEEDAWHTLLAAILAVYDKEAINVTKEELYHLVENLVDHKRSESLYKRLEESCVARVQVLLGQIVGRVNELEPEMFLVFFNKNWNEYCQDLLFIRSIFLSLDRKYAIPVPTVKSIWDLGLALFSQHVMSNAAIEEKLRKGLLNLIEMDRNGDDVDKILLKNLCRQMLVPLNLYHLTFEISFLEETARFYRAEIQTYIDVLPVSEVLLKIEKRLEEESERVLNFLDVTTRKPLITVVQTILILEKLDTLIERGLKFLLDKNSTPDLKRLYSLFLKVDSTLKLVPPFKDYIKLRGEEIVMNQQREDTMIDVLLLLKSTLDEILAAAFSSEEAFTFALKEAFEYVMTRRENRPAELLARFVDSKLKLGKDSRSFSEADLEFLLDKVIQLFRFIQGKDIFEAFYKHDLSKRLLMNKYTSIETEKSMIQKLKIECGSIYTAKLEGMFKDFEGSYDIVEAYKQSKHYLESTGISDFKILILTNGYWPHYPPVQCAVPDAIATFCSSFGAFYTSKYSGRRLVWQNHLSQLTLKAVFQSGSKELIVSFGQSVVLLLFNDHAKLSFNDLLALTQMDAAELKGLLKSLTTGGTRFLTRPNEPKNSSADITESDEFLFRSDFASKGKRIKANSTNQTLENVQQEKIEKNVFQDRQYQVDAAIVRIMKTRKSLSHQQLLTELYQQLKFPAKAADLKKRIDSLIEREFLERDKSDSNLYLYIS